MQMDALRGAADGMKLGDRVLFPGYLSEAELAALLSGCRALIFPSLYEGFGMPVIEAMAAGKPVLCSTVASLPEVAGDAALFFDPRMPAEIAGAIERIDSHAALRERLIRAGYANAARFSDPDRMAAEYLSVLKAMAGQRS
jgi:glycosyltransferase involved in cell wall biosynthesis